MRFEPAGGLTAGSSTLLPSAMKRAMYIFINKGLGMTAGKMAAQASHAAVEAFRLSDEAGAAFWLKTGYTKLVMEARDTEHLLLIEKCLRDKGYRVAPIIDEGRTETAPQSFTALGVEIVDRLDEKVKFDFSDFKTYREPKAAILSRGESAKNALRKH